MYKGKEMTHDGEQKYLALYERAVVAEERIAAALDRLAEHFAPEKERRTGRTAVLTTATYKREVEPAPQPPRRAATTIKGG